MCQLTYLHGFTSIVEAYLMNLTLLNASCGNKDGHGYFLFPNTLWKSKEDGQNSLADPAYFELLDKAIGDRKVISIISHVRAASRGFEIKDENSHPFKLGHLVLAHNGTLETKDNKDEVAGTIDSYWFLKKLESIVGEAKLTPEHIKIALDAFKGKFAFLIYDILQPDLLFVVKGKADLFYTRILNDKKEQVLFAINTTKRVFQVSLVDIFYRIFFKNTIVTEDPTSFDDESIYIYNLLTSEVTKTTVVVKEEPLDTTDYYSDTTDYYSYFARNNRAITTVNRSYSPNQNLNSDLHSDRNFVAAYLTHANELGLCFSEVNALAQHMTGESIIFCDSDDVEIVVNSMKWLAEKYNASKIDLWREIKKISCTTAIDIYRNNKLQFPWFINSKNGLKHVLNRIKKRDTHRASVSA